MHFFNHQIHQWYSFFKRDLPWRNTCDPYYIWLSEIILQQTRVNQGLAYYLNFTREFPTVFDLANASEDQVLKLWQGLGYYSRARNLHFTANQVKNQYKGRFPESFRELLLLKGIGDYTAAAIASICFNEKVPAVDGNVYRVLARFFGIGEPMDTPVGKKIFKKLATELISETDPGMHNQAMMEFGALQCTPQKPNCMECPLNAHCFAFLNNRMGDFPVKSKKMVQNNRYFNYFVVTDGEHTWLRKRTKNDIWKNLYEFPMVETSVAGNLDTLFSLDEVKELLNFSFAILHVDDWKVHLLTHQRIHFRIILVHMTGINQLPEEFVKVNKEDIYKFAVPKLLETYIQKRQNTTFSNQSGMFIKN